MIYIIGVVLFFALISYEEKADYVRRKEIEFYKQFEAED